MSFPPSLVDIADSGIIAVIAWKLNIHYKLWRYKITVITASRAYLLHPPVRPCASDPPLHLCTSQSLQQAAVAPLYLLRALLPPAASSTSHGCRRRPAYPTGAPRRLGSPPPSSSRVATRRFRPCLERLRAPTSSRQERGSPDAASFASSCLLCLDLLQDWPGPSSCTRSPSPAPR